MKLDLPLRRFQELFTHLQELGGTKHAHHIHEKPLGKPQKLGQDLKAHMRFTSVCIKALKLAPSLDRARPYTDAFASPTRCWDALRFTHRLLLESRSAEGQDR